MTFTASMRWQVNNGGTDGSSGGGGGFDPGGCTFATDGAATVANTNTPNFTSASYNFKTTDTGHWLYIASGTNWIAGWWKMTWDGANGVNLTASLGTAQVLNGGLNTAANVGNVSYAGGVTVATASPTGASWSVDYSRLAAGTAGITFTDMIIGATTTDFTSVLNPIGPNMIGNVIAVSSGTGFTQQRAQILSIPASVTARCDRTLGTTASTGGNSKLGGALLTIGQAGALHNTSQGIYVKYNATAFSSTSTTNNAAGGRMTLTSGSSTAMSFIRGFDTVCGDEYTPTNGLNRPTIQWGVNAGTLPIISGGTSCRIENFILDGSTFTGTRGIAPSTNNIIRKVKFLNFKSSSVVPAGTTLVADCEFTACSLSAALSIVTFIMEFRGCSFHDNTFNVITASSGQIKLIKCDFYNNTGASTNNVQATGAATVICDGVTMGTVGQHGFDIQAALAQGVFTNCYVQGAGGAGWNFGTAMDIVAMINCGGYNNTSGNFDVTKLTNSYDQIGFLSPSADVFTNLAGGDLTLNNTAGAGALLRAAGWPSTYPGMTGTNYSDVGAYQSQAVSSGGGGASVMGPLIARR